MINDMLYKLRRIGDQPARPAEVPLARAMASSSVENLE